MNTRQRRNILCFYFVIFVLFLFLFLCFRLFCEALDKEKSIDKTFKNGKISCEVYISHCNELYLVRD